MVLLGLFWRSPGKGNMNTSEISIKYKWESNDRKKVTQLEIKQE